MELDHDNLWYKVLVARYGLFQGRVREGGVVFLCDGTRCVVCEVEKVWWMIGGLKKTWLGRWVMVQK